MMVRKRELPPEVIQGERNSGRAVVTVNGAPLKPSALAQTYGGRFDWVGTAGEQLLLAHSLLNHLYGVAVADQLCLLFRDEVIPRLDDCEVGVCWRLTKPQIDQWMVQLEEA